MGFFVPFIVILAIGGGALLLREMMDTEDHCAEAVFEGRIRMTVKDFQYQITKNQYGCNKTKPIGFDARISSCFRPMQVHFDKKESAIVQLEMSSRNLEIASIPFRRHENDEIKMIVATVVSHDLSEYTRKFVLDQPVILKEGEKGEVEWKDTSLSDEPGKVQILQGTISFTLEDVTPKIVQCKKE